MPVYAATPRFAERHLHPRALALIIGAHAALLAGVMAVKMDLPNPLREPPIIVDSFPLPLENVVEHPKPQPQLQGQTAINRTTQIVPIPLPGPDIDPTPLPPNPLPGVDPIPQPDPLPLLDPIRVGPRFLTPAALVKPPYPESKRRLEQEASLRLRLTIDERGRVTAVEPVGKADAVFLDAARRHILAYWRYKPATEDGRGIATSTVVTLRFELDS